jgi:hypothetical protein
MKKLLNLVLVLILECLILYQVGASQEGGGWRTLVKEMQTRLESGALARDFRLSFNNHPQGKYAEEELLAYTLRGDGTAIIQMNNKVKVVKILPSEIIWLCKTIMGYKLEDLPENEPRASNSSSFAIVFRNMKSVGGVRLCNSQNDKNRQIIWQYLFRFGQILLDKTGLRDRNKPILPVCKGIIGCQEIDSDNDGRIDWLRLDVGFYSFSCADFIIDFSGYTQNIFFAQGNSSKEFFLNTYLLQSDWKNTRGFLKMGIDSKTAASATAPYIMDIGLDFYSYRNRKNFRTIPDLVFKGNGIWKFKVKLNQTVALEIKKGQSPKDKALGWFYVSEIMPDCVNLVARQYSKFTLGTEDFNLASWDCISAFLRLAQKDASSAIFEIGWNIPDKEGLDRRIRNFKEIIMSDSYRGNTESIKSSLDFHEKCNRELQELGDLEININYCLPPVEKIE